MQQKLSLIKNRICSRCIIASLSFNNGWLIISMTSTNMSNNSTRWMTLNQQGYMKEWKNKVSKKLGILFYRASHDMCTLRPITSTTDKPNESFDIELNLPN